MSRFILVAMTLAVTVAGCNRFPDNGLQIAANVPPDDQCVFSPELDARLLRGLYDVQYPSDYVVAPVVESYLIDNSLEFQADQNNLEVDNLEITLLLPDGTAPVFPEGFPNPYSVDTSAVLASGVSPGASPAMDVAAGTGIPRAYQGLILSVLAQTGFTSVILSIRAGGTTRGGFSQRSAPFRWPVDICSGCLNDCASEELEDSCLPGQDIWPYCLGGGTGGTGGMGGAGGAGP